jgi:hypothetical protein
MTAILAWYVAGAYTALGSVLGLWAIGVALTLQNAFLGALPWRRSVPGRVTYVRRSRRPADEASRARFTIRAVMKCANHSCTHAPSAAPPTCGWHDPCYARTHARAHARPRTHARAHMHTRPHASAHGRKTTHTEHSTHTVGPQGIEPCYTRL